MCIRDRSCVAGLPAADVREFRERRDVEWLPFHTVLSLPDDLAGVRREALEQIMPWLRSIGRGSVAREVAEATPASRPGSWRRIAEPLRRP
eukprot:8946124-Alexandrium_andersonii.AAC.1